MKLANIALVLALGSAAALLRANAPKPADTPAPLPTGVAAPDGQRLQVPGLSRTAKADPIQAGGIVVDRADIIITKKKGYIHLLWDAFPASVALKALTGTAEAGRLAVLDDLVRGPVTKADPDVPKVRADVVEFPLRDDYGAPVWSSIKRLGHCVYLRSGSRLLRQPDAKKE